MPAPRSHRRVRTPVGSRPVVGALLRELGELLITAGFVVLLFVVYELWVTDIFAARDQRKLHTAIERTWSRPGVAAPRASAPAGVPAGEPSASAGAPVSAPAVKLGDGFAILRIPRFGSGYSPVIVEGVATDDLRKGPGHYPGTAMPGAIGNFVVSGHRTTYLHPFGDLDRLRIGDPIVVEVADRYYTYRVTQSEVVAPSDLAVIAPLPDHLGIRPTRAMLTFTTCNPKYSASTRLVVHAQLHATTMKSRGLPAAISAG
ncbi:MAG: class E sortase [Frankia sp.]